MSQRDVIIEYTNHRGERSERRIRFAGPCEYFFWGSTSYHPEPQYFLEAFDVAKGEHRTFAMKDIHSWRPYTSEPTEESS